MNDVSAQDIIDALMADPDDRALAGAYSNRVKRIISNAVHTAMLAAYRNTIIAIDEKAMIASDVYQYQALVKNELDRMMGRDV